MKKFILIFSFLIVIFSLYFFLKQNFNKTNQLTVGAWVKSSYDTNYPVEQVIMAQWTSYKESFKDKQNYLFNDLSTINPNIGGFAGGVFDGRYLYLIPIGLKHNYSGIVARYDSYLSFEDKVSWDFFNLAELSNRAKGFSGGVFDGKYIYFVPNIGDGDYSGLVVRHDVSSQFKMPSSWQFFDLEKLNVKSKGFWGAVFDGRYIYFVPHRRSKGVYSGLVSRYDTSSEFDNVNSWSFFDLSALNSSLVGFVGAVFDGTFIYFVPNRIDDNNFSGIVVRYNTSQPFTHASSWSYFDTRRLNSKSFGFAGAAFTGKYIYFIPLFTDINSFSGLIARYNTHSLFDSSESWSFFDISLLNNLAKGFTGGIFDGRYLYLVPFRNFDENSNYKLNGFSGILARFDTIYNFDNLCAWDFFDLSIINSDLKGFWGGVYDGKFIYYIPQKTGFNSASGKIVRFKTINDQLSSYRLLLSQMNQSGSFSGGPFGVKFEVNTDKGNFSISANKLFKKDTWYYIVGSLGNKSLKLYINGELVAQNSLSLDVSINSKSLYRNISMDTRSNIQFNGIVKNKFIMRYLLTSDNIVTLYRMGIEK